MQEVFRNSSLLPEDWTLDKNSRQDRIFLIAGPFIAMQARQRKTEVEIWKILSQTENFVLSPFS